MFCLIYSPFAYNGNFGYGLFIYDITFIGRDGRGMGGGVLGFTLHTTFDKKRSVSNHMDPPLWPLTFTPMSEKGERHWFQQTEGLRLADFSCRLLRAPPNSSQSWIQLHSEHLKSLHMCKQLAFMARSGWERPTDICKHTHNRGRVNSRPFTGTHTQYQNIQCLTYTYTFKFTVNIYSINKIWNMTWSLCLFYPHMLTFKTHSFNLTL